MKKKADSKVKNDIYQQKMVTLTLPQRGKQALPAGQAVQFAKQWITKNHFILASTLMKELTQILPNYKAAWLVLFDALYRHGDIFNLQKETQRCLISKPRFIPALVSLSVAQRLLLLHSKALKNLQKAAKIDPRNSEIWNHIGVTHKEMGKHEQAITAFERCLSIKPDHIGAIWNRSDLIGSLDDDEYKRCEQIINKKRSKREQAMLHYALARSDEKKQDFDSEFTHIKQGAALMRSIVNYDHNADIKQIDELIQTVKGPQESNQVSEQEKSITDKTPIFICGLPRSGTTLAEQILSNHSDVIAGDEINDLPLACDKVLRMKGISKPFPTWINDLNESDWKSVGDNYLFSTQALQKQSHFTDKNLLNYKAIGVIQPCITPS